MLASLKDQIDPQSFMMLKYLLEPGIVFVICTVLFFIGVGSRLWGYLMVASACLFVKGLLIVNFERHKMLNVLDGQMPQHHGSEAFTDGQAGSPAQQRRGRPGQGQDAGEFIATIDPKLWERQRK